MNLLIQVSLLTLERLLIGSNMTVAEEVRWEMQRIEPILFERCTIKGGFVDGAVSSAGFEVSRGYSHFPRYSTVMDEKMKHMLTLANSEDIGENVPT